MVQLKVALNKSGRKAYKISIPYGSIKRQNDYKRKNARQNNFNSLWFNEKYDLTYILQPDRIFQFLMVQLKVQHKRILNANKTFQFLMVQLKALV